MSSELPREVLMWLQSLDLSFRIINPKWELANGYLVGEIFSRYYPAEIKMSSFTNGVSLPSRQHNWHCLTKFFKKKRFNIPQEYIDGAIHCKERYTYLLMEAIYTVLTNRKWRSTAFQVFHHDLADFAYQLELPLHARSTASKAVKNNLTNTELIANKNLLANAQKAQNIISSHMEMRSIRRMDNPGRFHIQPTLGELSVRIGNNPGKNDPKQIISSKNDERTKDSKVRFKEK